MDKVLLTIPDAAAVLSIGRSKLYELIGSGAIKAVRIGRGVRIPVEEVERFARELKEAAVA